MVKLEKIKNDHVSGATEITIQCAEYLREQAQQYSGEEPDQFVLHLEKIGALVKEAQPAMAPVYNAVHAILNALRKSYNGGATLPQLKDVTAHATKNFIDGIRSALKNLAEAGATLIDTGQRIMTYSSSRAVAAILKHARAEGKTFRVIAPESRPMYEGRILAQDLGSYGIPCTVIIDGAISTFIDRADMVLIGADRISEKSVVNKIGTRAIACMAREKQVPLYCACETTKFLSSLLLPFTQHEMPPAEVWDRPPENVEIRNLYFEEIPLNLFSGCITERGILKGGEVKKFISESPT